MKETNESQYNKEHSVNFTIPNAGLVDLDKLTTQNNLVQVFFLLKNNELYLLNNESGKLERIN